MHLGIFFRGFVAIVSDENPRSGDNGMLRSIYLERSELFIYKCLTSRHRLGPLLLPPSQLPSFFPLSYSLVLSLLSRNLRATWVHHGRCSKRGGKEEQGNGEERKDQSAKEGSREDKLSRCPSNEPSPLQRGRCYEKRKTVATSANRKKKREPTEMVEERTEKTAFVKLNSNYWTRSNPRCADTLKNIL